MRFKIVAALLLAVGAGGGLVYHGLAAEPGKAAADDGSRRLVNVPSRVEGVLEVIGTAVKEGEKVPAGRLVTLKVGDEEKKYRRLRVGDEVEAGQLLARLEDRVGRDVLAIARQKVIAAEADWKAAVKTRDEAHQRYLTLERVFNGQAPGVRSMEDLRAAKLTWDRYTEEEVSKKAGIETARLEEKLAQTRLEMYEIRSPARGIITKINKQPGEAVRAFEPVLQILTAPERDK
jgi:multidrug efflux pump subunit AcrA (membrane-fusion protein)